MITRILFSSLLLLYISSCNKQKTRDKILIVATTNIIANSIQNLVGDSAEVVSLMGPGVDPHLYKVTQKDMVLLSEANIIFHNGLHLEGKMSELLHNLSKQKKVFAISDNVDKNKLLKISETIYDPHIWFDAKIWKDCILHASNILLKETSIDKTYLKDKTTAYTTQLDSLDIYIRKQINEIPENARILVTAHDAFGYFGKAYNIKVQGLQGISTIAEYSIRDIVNITNIVVNNNIKAIFAETSVPSKSLEAVIIGCKERGSNVKLVEGLYSDALGKEGSLEGTYIGMIKFNTNLIVDNIH